jgi:hypothetical protein
MNFASGTARLREMQTPTKLATSILRACLWFPITHLISCFAIPNTFCSFAAGTPNVHRTVSTTNPKWTR